MVSTLRTRDDRVLAYKEFGDPNGKPVIAMHGTPGSRIGPHLRALRLYPRGIRLISYDRPGYGGSGRRPGPRAARPALDRLRHELPIEPLSRARGGHGRMVLAEHHGQPRQRLLP